MTRAESVNGLLVLKCLWYKLHIFYVSLLSFHLTTTNYDFFLRTARQKLNLYPMLYTWSVIRMCSFPKLLGVNSACTQKLAISTLSTVLKQIWRILLNLNKQKLDKGKNTINFDMNELTNGIPVFVMMLCISQVPPLPLALAALVYTLSHSGTDSDITALMYYIVFAGSVPFSGKIGPTHFLKMCKKRCSFLLI